MVRRPSCTLTHLAQDGDHLGPANVGNPVGSGPETTPGHGQHKTGLPEAFGPGTPRPRRLI